MARCVSIEVAVLSSVAAWRRPRVLGSCVWATDGPERGHHNAHLLALETWGRAVAYFLADGLFKCEAAGVEMAGHETPR